MSEAIEVWVVIDPEGKVPRTYRHDSISAFVSQKAASFEMREHATIDYEIENRTDLLEHLSASEARDRGYRLRKATLHVPAGRQGQRK